MSENSLIANMIYWVAYSGAVKGGVSKIVEELKSVYAQGVLFRGGDAINANGLEPKEDVKKYVDEFGQKAGVWIYARPDRIDNLVSMMKAYQDQGIDWFVVNGEIEFKNPHGQVQAQKISERLLKDFPTSKIAHAPFAMLMSHGTGVNRFPYEEFSQFERYDQWYTHEFGGMSIENWWKRYVKERDAYYKSNPNVGKQVARVIIDGYGKQLGKAWNMKFPPPGNWEQDDLKRMLACLHQGGETEVHMYTFDASYASGAWKDFKSLANSLPDLTEPGLQLGDDGTSNDVYWTERENWSASHLPDFEVVEDLN